MIALKTKMNHLLIRHIEDFMKVEMEQVIPLMVK